jgi:hypothetical protein
LVQRSAKVAPTCEWCFPLRRRSPNDVVDRLVREWQETHPDVQPKPDSGPLSEVLERQAPWLFEVYGFKVVYAEYSYRHFGNSSAYLRSDRLRVRFIRDRGQYFVDLGPLAEPGAWYNLLAVYRAVKQQPSELTYELDPLLQILQKELPALIDALGPDLDRTKRSLSL